MQHFQRTSRDVATQPRSICADTTRSGFTAEIHSRGPSLAWVALGRPDRSPYLPYSPAEPGVPRCVVDGTLWERSTSRPNAAEANQALEARVRCALNASRGAPDANGAAPGPRATSIQAVTRLAVAELLGFTA